MKIEKISIDAIKPYENNAKLHPPEQIEQIKKVHPGVWEQRPYRN